MTHISLTALGKGLQPEVKASANGLARRLVKEEGAFKQLALRLRAGGSLPAHDNPGEATLLVLEGAVRLIEADSGAVHELRAGDLLTVPHQRHSVEADEESLLLLSFAAA